MNGVDLFRDSEVPACMGHLLLPTPNIPKSWVRSPWFVNCKTSWEKCSWKHQTNVLVFFPAMHFIESVGLRPQRSLRLNFKSFILCKWQKILLIFPSSQRQKSVTETGELQWTLREAPSWFFRHTSLPTVGIKFCVSICQAKTIRRYRRAGFMSTGAVLKLPRFLLIAARTLNQLIGLGPCGQRSLICGECGEERQRSSGLVESQDREPWRGSPSLVW